MGEVSSSFRVVQFSIKTMCWSQSGRGKWRENLLDLQVLLLKFIRVASQGRALGSSDSALNSIILRSNSLRR